MAHDSQSLTIEPGAWSPEADRLIALAHQHASVAEIRAQVESGIARLFYVKHDGYIIGAFVLRVDTTADGAEGVIVSAAGRLPGTDLVATCLPAIEGMFRGVRAIRYHTARPELARRLMAHGYHGGEIVCRKTIQ